MRARERESEREREGESAGEGGGKELDAEIKLFNSFVSFARGQREQSNH